MPEISENTKSIIGWSGVVLAIVTGLSATFSWIANHIAEPVTLRLIKNYDAMEANAEKNTAVLDGVHDELKILNKRYEVGLGKQDETHELQRVQIDEQKKAAEILKEAVPATKVKKKQS